ncbi:hypothetical protein Plhal703r1_c02g0010051 [Plasmopara halstedii]
MYYANSLLNVAAYSFILQKTSKTDTPLLKSVFSLRREKNGSSVTFGLVVC